MLKEFVKKETEVLCGEYLARGKKSYQGNYEQRQKYLKSITSHMIKQNDQS
jgi:hypothetical protein